MVRDQICISSPGCTAGAVGADISRAGHSSAGRLGWTGRRGASGSGRDWRRDVRGPFPSLGVRLSLPGPWVCCRLGAHTKDRGSCSLGPGHSEMVPQEFHPLPELGSQQCSCGSWILSCTQISFFMLLTQQLKTSLL